ncbi:hypothetical protein [Aliivibrio fischeri]|uniref:restriction endonuclease n=1 Tax=Aliivibrio fischeri TaxID=668 RepID=UPI00080DCF61|nr:hypothetical protein [Aliivibrio fischeri]OCH02943.1 hypothetical protein A6E11_03755 [Aliivibrio fischeri]
MCCIILQLIYTYALDKTIIYCSGTEQLYFVVEIKLSIFSDDLRDAEKAKIKCGIAHFDALSKDDDGNEIKNSAKFVEADNFDTFSGYFVN